MKDKAHRMVNDTPKGAIDASGYKVPGMLNADVQTGMRPVSPRQYKRGGTVSGECGPVRADRKARKAGGQALTPDSYLNRDVKEANQERSGTKHVGGMKSGGAAHSDEMEDIRLLRKVVKPGALKAKERVGKAGGGALDTGILGLAGMAANALSKDADKKKGGGSVSDGTIQGTRPTGGRLARREGGRAGRGKVDVNIVINTKPPETGLPMQGAAMPPPMGPKPIAPPPPVAAAPPMAMGMPPGLAGGLPPAPMGGPPMPRKRGGPVHMTAGAMGGEGRLQKIREYGHPQAKD